MKTAIQSTGKVQRKLGLKFDFNAITELEEKFGLNILDKATMDKMDLTPVRLRQLVWAGLLHKSPDLTLVDAGKKFGLVDLPQVTQEVQDAIVEAFTGK